MRKTHLVIYTANAIDGTEVQGVARVDTDQVRPTYGDCALQIPGCVDGWDLGPEPQYTLRYQTPAGMQEKRLGSADVVTVGTALVACEERGQVWEIEVFNDEGWDCAPDFHCFV